MFRLVVKKNYQTTCVIREWKIKLNKEVYIIHFYFDKIMKDLSIKFSNWNCGKTWFFFKKFQFCYAIRNYVFIFVVVAVDYVYDERHARIFIHIDNSMEKNFVLTTWSWQHHTNTLGKSHRIALAPIFYASVFVYFKVKNYL